MIRRAFLRRMAAGALAAALLRDALLRDVPEIVEEAPVNERTVASWDDEPGAIWNRIVGGPGERNAFYAYGTMYFQAGTTKPSQTIKVELS